MLYVIRKLNDVSVCSQFVDAVDLDAMTRAGVDFSHDVMSVILNSKTVEFFNVISCTHR